ncbi:MAG TPA: ribonuclease P protein component [Candidatus Paceibacterota bacterium]|nr:ribonuclease P protein component [Candidatus Paceibacterota bacterium]
MLKKRDRLTAKDIESLSLGKSVFGTLISLRHIPSKKAGFSVSASKKAFPTAVSRGRARRRVYAAIEKSLGSVKATAFVMIIPKKEALAAPFGDLAAEIGSLFKKAGLLD